MAKDPRGIKGISPFWEAIAAGDAAWVARDFDTAILRYKEAVKAEPQNPMGHYRLGETHLSKGQIPEGQAALEVAVKNGAKDANVMAKALFVLADLAERQVKLAEARDGWKRYESHANSHSEIKSFPASAVERQKRIATHDQLAQEYAVVKDRIKKREAELMEKAAANAK